jgi:GT2 family glycosyltransferase
MPSDRPDCSIVIVGHSVREELQACLESIESHAGVRVEVLYIDNASTDDSVAWIRSNQQDVQMVELARNVGVAAREEGLRRATGRHTMFLDSDASLTAGALPALVQALDEHPEWGLLGPRLVYADGSPQPSARRFPSLLLPFLRRPPLERRFGDGAVVRRHLMHDMDIERTRPVLYVLGACQIFRTDLARAAGSFDDRIFFGPDDADWCIRIRDAGGEVVYFPEATVVHGYRRASSAKPVSRIALRHLKAFAYFQWKYRRRRRELQALERELDLRAGAG